MDEAADLKGLQTFVESRRLVIGSDNNGLEIAATFHLKNNQGRAEAKSLAIQCWIGNTSTQSSKTAVKTWVPKYANVAKTARTSTIRKDWERLFPLDEQAQSPAEGVVAAEPAASSKLKKQKTSHVDEHYETWKQGGVVNKKELKKIAKDMKVYMSLKQAPPVTILEDMSEYRRLMGSKSTVFEAATYVQFLVEYTSGKSQGDRKEEVSEVETVFSEETTDLLGRAMQYKEKGSHGTWPEFAQLVGASPALIEEVEAVYAGWMLLASF